MSNPFTDLIKAARDLVSSAHESSDRASLVPTEAVVRLRHAAARAATTLATSHAAPGDDLLRHDQRRLVAGVAETTLGVTGAGEPPLVSLGQGDFTHGLDAGGKPFPAHPRAGTFPIARTAHGQHIEVGPAGHVEPRA